MREPLNTNKGNERSSIANADDVRACVLGEGVWFVFFKVKINFKKWEIWKKKKKWFTSIYTDLEVKELTHQRNCQLHSTNKLRTAGRVAVSTPPTPVIGRFTAD